MSKTPDTISPNMLHAYVDDQLNAVDRAQVEAYLAKHPEKAAEVVDWQAQNATLRELFPAPDSLPAIASLTANQPRPPWRAVAAAVAMLGLGLTVGWFGHGIASGDRQNTEVVANLVREAVAAHVVYASDPVRPVEIPATQETLLVKWLSKRLGRALIVPDLSAQGFKLVGGRLLPAQEGPAAQFMYEDDKGHRITLFAVGQSPGKMAAFQFKRQGKTGSFYWQDEKLAYALVGDVGRNTLSKLATAVYKQLS